MIRYLDSGSLNQLYLGHIDHSSRILVGIVDILHNNIILTIDSRNYGFGYWYCCSNDTSWEPLI